MKKFSTIFKVNNTSGQTHQNGFGKILALPPQKKAIVKLGKTKIHFTNAFLH